MRVWRLGHDLNAQTCFNPPHMNAADFPRRTLRVRADYHVTSEVDELDPYAQRIRDNPMYERTVFVVQGGFMAERGNELVGRRLLPHGAALFRYRRVARGRYASPSRTPRTLVHGP